MKHTFLQHDILRAYDKLQQMQGAGTKSSDSTLAEGRAALDVVTRKILTRTSGRGYTLAGCLTARINIDRLWRSLRHLLTADSVKKCVHHKKQPVTLLLLVAKIF